ncbi:MAG TPA: hypothetical protein EYO07_00080 [Candidatus Marinimicrobia bacterium]|nr:hypothetical protein [Candidatus Neomarinimicrobiota bacterium]
MLCRRILFFKILNFIFLYTLSAQPDPKYRPFDWVIYRASGAINSISEGYSFVYIGTDEGGIYRYHLYSNDFNDPITTAQGLRSNTVTGVHFDHNTGIIWAAVPGYIQYSYTREGDWRNIALSELGLHKTDVIRRLGSSDNYVWAQANSIFVKMDRSSGVLAGLYPIPDELNIQWSSGPYQNQPDLKEIFSKYTVMSGWMLTGDRFIDQYGRYLDITTGLVGNHGDVWVGSSDGTFFQGKTTMETFFPFSFGIRGVDVGALHHHNRDLWIGSADYDIGRGITRLDPITLQADHFDFDVTVNMNPTDISSILDLGDELWVGGNSLVLLYDKDDNYWRTLGIDIGIPEGNINALAGDTTYVWVGSSRGLRQIGRKSRNEDLMGIESLFYNHPVYALHLNEYGLWIGTRTGVYLYDPKNPQVVNGSSIGISYLDFPLSQVMAIREDNNVLYFAANLGIVKFDLTDRIWELVISAVQYDAFPATAIAMHRNLCFIGTKIGFFRINLKTGLIRKYNYPFIGKVNSMVMLKNNLWLGTSEGLVRFKWKKDL